MPSYKALYEQQLKKNNEHEEKIYELEVKIVDLVDVRDIAEILGEDPEDYMRCCCAYTLAKKIKEHREMEEEIKKLKEERQIIWDTMKKDPALVLLLPDSMYDVGVETESESEEETEDEVNQ